MAYVAANGTIDYQVRDGVAWVFFNQPETRNAIDGRMQRDLESVWAEINMDDNVRVVVVAGRGDVFSDGLDVDPDPRAAESRLDWLATYAHHTAPDLEAAGLGPVDDTQGLFQIGLPDRPRGRPAKPLIVAVHGACSSAALSFVMYADLVICSDDAEFFDRRVNVGDAALEETAGLISLRSLPRLIALRIAYQGEDFKLGAERAFQLGMVTEVTSRQDLLSTVEKRAKQIGEASPAALRALVAGYWESVNLPYGQVSMLAPLHGQQARTMDGKEGYLAYVEGRQPVWPSLTTWSPPWPAFRLPTPL